MGLRSSNNGRGGGQSEGSNNIMRRPGLRNLVIVGILGLVFSAAPWTAHAMGISMPAGDGK